MKGKDVKVGSVYAAKVSGRIVPVRVNARTERFCTRRNTMVYVYRVCSFATGRVLEFRGAAKLRFLWQGDFNGRPVRHFTPEYLGS